MVFQGIEWDGAAVHSLLSETEEELAPRGGLAAVESTGEFVKVVIQVVLFNGALMCAEKPTVIRAGLDKAVADLRILGPRRNLPSIITSER